MTESTELSTARGSAPATASQVRDHVRLINTLLKEVMKPDVHYGTIPGTAKPTLYKPGAEKICMMFRLSTQIDVDRTDLEDGHREYQVVVRLVTPDGLVVGEGIGSCSTMEGKYRYRWDNTEQPVPQEYWQSRDPALLGGPSFTARKAWTGSGNQRSQKWFIFQRVDHENPADYYNTALKMAKKRAQLDAVLTATGASDLFDQDLDDVDGVPPSSGPAERASDGGQKKDPPRQPQASSGGGDKPATENQLRLIRKKVADSGLDESEFLARYGVDTYEQIRMAQVNEILEWLQSSDA